MDQHKFERIDKGLKRTTTLAGKPMPLSITHQGRLSAVNDDALIDRVADGSFVSHLAREFGVTHAAMHQRLKDHPGYKQALKLRNAARLEQHQDGIENADNALSLARAREAFKAASWRAERECPEEWGQKQEVTHRLPDGPVISIVLSMNAPEPPHVVVDSDVQSQQLPSK